MDDIVCSAYRDTESRRGEITTGRTSFDVVRMLGSM